MGILDIKRIIFFNIKYNKCFKILLAFTSFAKVGKEQMWLIFDSFILGILVCFMLGEY